MNNQADAVGFIAQEELTEKPKQLILFPFFVWMIACLFYTVQYFLRVSIAGLSHTISRSIHQDATALSFVAAAGIAIGDSTDSVVTTYYAPDTVETQRMVNEQIRATFNHITRGEA